MLAAVDDDARLVELPIGATEDRVVGSLDLQKVLRDGEHAFSPGLLARAHGGVLYVDEVNLLHDHLVDVLLDAAAMGRVHVERDGVSHSHEARFVLIGTMNPEEGELRPQLLDRFGLTVDVPASRDVDVRVRGDPRADGLRGRPRRRSPPATPRTTPSWPAGSPRPGRRVADVVLPDNELRRIAALCAAFDVDGMRADLVVARTAVAHAAWRGRDRPSPRRTSGSPPNWRCRTGAGATRSTTRAWIPTGSTRRWHRPARPPTRARPRPGARSAGGGEHPVNRSESGCDRNVIRQLGVARGPARRRRRPSAPRRWWCPVSGRARRAGVRGPATAPARRCRPPTIPTPGTALHLFGTLLAAAGRQQRPGRSAAACPTTCGARSAKAAKATW